MRTRYPFNARYWLAAKAVADVLIDYEKRNYYFNAVPPLSGCTAHSINTQIKVSICVQCMQD